MKRETKEVGSYGVNCTILSREADAWVIDPGQEGARILAHLAANNLTPRAILLTHAHFDHITAIADLQSAFPDLPVCAHRADWPMFGHPFNQLPGEYESIGVPKNLADATTLALPGVTVIETPGHTPGGVCYYVSELNTLFSGDTLFANSIGRTDFPGGSMTQMLASLKRLMTLPDETIVVPGHGSETTIGREKMSNPYLV